MASGMISNLPEPVAVTLLVIDAINQQNIPYVIVGSLASTQHGLARSTLDSDLLVKIELSQVPALISQLQDTFYADEMMAINAINNKSSFNVIHLETMFKVDLFVAHEDLFDQAQLDRRRPRAVAKGLDQEIYILSAEDTILSKLKWYRLGGEQSEQQWRDVIGVYKVQREQLDFQYLHKMAVQLQVGDLLERILEHE